jgi:hypothetical protein
MASLCRRSDADKAGNRSKTEAALVGRCQDPRQHPPHSNGHIHLVSVRCLPRCETL